MPTIKDVARKTGFSVGTISRVLNNRGYISDETRKKVDLAMKELNYQPNEVARSLSKQRSNTIGVIVPHIVHPYFAKLISHIELAVSKERYKILLCNSYDEIEKELDYIEMFKSNRVAGIILCSSSVDVTKLLDLNIPLVTIERPIDVGTASIECDNYQGGVLAGRHLAECGCRHVVYFSGIRNSSMPADLRSDGFVSVCREESMVYREYPYELELYYEMEYRKYIERVIKENPQIDGIFASSDLIAAQVIQVCTKKGISIPERMKLIGFDDVNIASLTTPTITTIRQPLKEMAEQAVETIIKAQMEEMVLTKSVFPVSLIQRESTQIAKKIGEKTKENKEMKKIENKIMLITYADSMGNNIRDLKNVLDWYVQDAIGGIHLLPFFPSTGDRGFAPTTYREVESSFGDWNDVENLSKKYYLMFDYMINHISAQSEYYQDFLKKKDDSKYKDLFIRYKDFWENGEPTQEQVDAIYKRKPRAPYADAKFADGSKEKVWCTFDEEQIDINCKSQTAKTFIRENLKFLAEHGAAIIRLDAFAYATKEAGTSCFFKEPQVWNLLGECNQILKEYKVELLPEIHEHYTMQMKIAEKDFYVYDFALPMLLLHALYYGEGRYLKNWLDMCPKKQFTTLDTHDGIGVVDVKDLLPEEEVNKTKEDIFQFGANVKKIYNTAAYHNLDIYQINCTYYSALGDDDQAYLLARAIQFFAPGIPQVYYVGLLAGRNDLELIEKTKEGRNINRHYYTMEEIEQEVKRPVVDKLFKLMRFRNAQPAFHVDGQCEVSLEGKNGIRITRTYQNHRAILKADLKTYEYTIECFE